MSYEKDRAAFLNVAGRNGLTVKVCNAIIRRARMLEVSNLRECNEPMNEDQQTRQRIQDEQMEAEILKLLDGTGIKVRWSGDPRGYAVGLIFPDNTWNTWGGAECGYGVPTRTIEGN